MKKIISLFLCLIALFFVGCAPTKMVHQVDSGKEAEYIAKLAMSTSSMWMIDLHVKKIQGSIGESDLPEAIEEAEELFEWIKGTVWTEALVGPALVTEKAVSNLLIALQANNEQDMTKSIEMLNMAQHHLHHELMEIVAQGKERKASKGSEHHH